MPSNTTHPSHGPAGRAKRSAKPKAIPHPRDFLGYRLWHVHHAWQRALERALMPIGITHIQFVLLLTIAWLDDQRARPSQAELIEFTRFEKMMVSRVLANLDERGLITRSPRVNDPRASDISLTPFGKLAFDAALPLLLTAEDRFFGCLEEARRIGVGRDLAFIMDKAGL